MKFKLFCSVEILLTGSLFGDFPIGLCWPPKRCSCPRLPRHCVRLGSGCLSVWPGFWPVGFVSWILKRSLILVLPPVSRGCSYWPSITWLRGGLRLRLSWWPLKWFDSWPFLSSSIASYPIPGRPFIPSCWALWPFLWSYSPTCTPCSSWLVLNPLGFAI